MHQTVVDNQRNAALLLGGVAGAVVVVVTLVGLLVGQALLGLLLGVVLAVSVVAGAWFGAAPLTLRLTRAHPIDRASQPRLFNLVDGLCTSSGLTAPHLFMVDDDAPNACALGRGRRHAAIVVTRGLVEKLSRVELEGVLAHELVHVKRNDVLPATLAVALFGPFAPRVVGRRREGAADLAAVRLTRYPPGLIAALIKLRDDPATFEAAPQATTHLWIDEPPPPAGQSAGRGDDRHPPLDERIALLREL